MKEEKTTLKEIDQRDIWKAGYIPTFEEKIERSECLPNASLGNPTTGKRRCALGEQYRKQYVIRKMWGYDLFFFLGNSI